MNEKYHYEPGAIHNDHHQELNIGSVPEKALGDIIKSFFKDGAEDAEFEEVDDGTGTMSSAHQRVDSLSGSGEADQSMPVGKCFRYTSDFVKQKVIAIAKEYYHESAANLALIEVALFDHNLLLRRNKHTAFVKTLIAWGAIGSVDGDTIKKLANDMAKKQGTLPTCGYMEWKDDYLNDKKTCLDIGGILGDTIKYSRKKEP